MHRIRNIDFKTHIDFDNFLEKQIFITNLLFGIRNALEVVHSLTLYFTIKCGVQLFPCMGGKMYFNTTP